ncbi:hypothetical protein [Pigmentiphaga daeguensis]|uniref:hypothetical protein n=1 Tax=Pigmentiphaga daeguensis TaxID=414049 RepID=UPI0031D15C22
MKTVEYELDSAREIIDIAKHIVADGQDSVEARRTVAYLGNRSIEMILKSFLEHAGVPLRAIKEASGSAASLLARTDACFVQVEIVPGHRCWVPAKRLRAVAVEGEELRTIGGVLESLPQARRFGPAPAYRDNPPEPETLLRTSQTLLSWVERHWDAARADRWDDADEE